MSRGRCVAGLREGLLGEIANLRDIARNQPAFKRIKCEQFSDQMVTLLARIPKSNAFDDKVVFTTIDEMKHLCDIMEVDDESIVKGVKIAVRVFVDEARWPCGCWLCKEELAWRNRHFTS